MAKRALNNEHGESKGIEIFHGKGAASRPFREGPSGTIVLNNGERTSTPIDRNT